MKQLEIIDKYNKIFKRINSIQAAIIIGSFGRKNPKANSDIDYQILVDERFDNDLFFNEIKSNFGNELKHSLFLINKNKWCFYLTDDYIVTEIFVCNQLSVLDKYYLGSEITNPKDAIIFDKTNQVYPYLRHITKDKQEHFIITQKRKVEHLITDFQNRFEACSNSHAKSDGYKFSVLLFHALNDVVRLIYLCEGAEKFDYMPPNFLTDYSYPKELGVEEIGTMDLRLANTHKRKLLDLFVKYLPIAIQKFGLQLDSTEIINFLEGIYKRDYFWNFRDIAKYNHRIAKGQIYRSSSLSLIKNESSVLKMLKEYGIKTIIDLRAPREIDEHAYSDTIKKELNIINIPFDPWNQSVEFKNTHNTGTNVEIAYQFFAVDCKAGVKEIVKLLLDTKNPVVIHCHAGKDRTGIVISILHLLADADDKTIYDDYLASEMDTKKEYIDIVLNIINRKGGIEAYLIDCGITENEIKQLKYKLQHGRN